MGASGASWWFGGDELPDSVVDQFERDSLSSPTSDDWGDYTGDTGGATIQSTTVLEGESSLKLDAGNGITTQRSSGYSPTEIRFLIQASDTDGAGGDGHRIQILDSGTLVIFFDLEEDGTAEAGLGDQNLGSWSADTTYRVRLFNIDFDNNQYDAELIADATDTVEASDSGIPFDNNASSINEILIDRNNSNGGSTEPMHVDDIRSEPNA